MIIDHELLKFLVIQFVNESAGYRPYTRFGHLPTQLHTIPIHTHTHKGFTDDTYLPNHKSEVPFELTCSLALSILLFSSYFT